MNNTSNNTMNLIGQDRKSKKTFKACGQFLCILVGSLFLAGNSSCDSGNWPTTISDADFNNICDELDANFSGIPTGPDNIRYNVFSRKAVHGVIHIEGAVAAGTAVIASGFSFNTKQQKIGLNVGTAGGQVNLQQGTFYGDYHHKQNDHPVPTKPVNPAEWAVLQVDAPGTWKGESTLPFDALQTRYSDARQELCDESTLGTTDGASSISPSNVGTLSGSNSINRFFLTKDDVNNMKQLIFNVHPDSINLVCITDTVSHTALLFKEFQNSGVKPENILWITDLGGLDIANFQFLGSILIPESPIECHNTEIKGQVIASNMHGQHHSCEVHENLFEACHCIRDNTPPILHYTPADQSICFLTDDPSHQSCATCVGDLSTIDTIQTMLTPPMVTATDNCSVCDEPLITYQEDKNTGSTLHAYDYTLERTWVASDCNEIPNTTTHSHTITVKPCFQ